MFLFGIYQITKQFEKKLIYGSMKDQDLEYLQFWFQQTFAQTLGPSDIEQGTLFLALLKYLFQPMHTEA